MNGTDKIIHSLATVAAEHRELKRLVRRLCQLSQQSGDETFLGAALPRLRDQICRLRDFMEHHQAQETLGGYLEDAAARLPRLAATASAIELQHPQLMADADALVAKSNECRPTTKDWQMLGAAVSKFAERLLAHEEAENELLREGFNEDPALFE